jgi:hypothetical protein
MPAILPAFALAGLSLRVLFLGWKEKQISNERMGKYPWACRMFLLDDFFFE